ncbi:MAG: aldehyde dehydrogenase family protein [Planctomycetota bacterium]
MKFFLAGTWQDRDARLDVINPGNGDVLDTVPIASEADVESALESAVEGAKVMAALTGYERFQILRRAADLLFERRELLARTLSSEVGKPIREALVEVDRAAQTMELSGEEAKRLGGEVLPLDGGSGVKNKLGFTLRVPCGVVAAITPFNFPIALVCHKVGPALAAGNAVILKPASDTPLISLQLVEILLEAGLPPLALSCITGSGRVIGSAICRDARVRKVSFTGSQEVGEQICSVAGIKRVTMELGSNSPLIVLPDADLDKVVSGVVLSGFANAGQICISAQRLIVADEVHDELVHRLVPEVESIVSGDQLDERTQIGPMVRDTDAQRVQEWIHDAVQEGATLACGGDRDGAFMQPTLLLEAKPEMKVVREELFGPGVAVIRAGNVDDAIQLTNDTDFGLSAGVFTQDVDVALRFAKEVNSGNIHINWGPLWRTDLMPYGGLKNSGLGKEGPKYAIEEMTEMKTVVIHS